MSYFDINYFTFEKYKEFCAKFDLDENDCNSVEAFYHYCRDKEYLDILRRLKCERKQ